LWIFTTGWIVIDVTALERELELWFYKFSTIVVYTTLWPWVPWQPDLGIFFLPQAQTFLSSILTSSTKLLPEEHTKMLGLID
jgi:hypothetical protein